MHLDLDTLVIGAGVVGLAVARALQLAGREVVLVERAEQVGSETSARNSEVIHAGIYYPPGSLKARLCVAGKALLYAYCAERGIAHRRLGKLIVATEANEAAALAGYRARAAANGVTDLESLDAAAIRALEPAVRAEAGLFSPGTGILDSHAYLQSLLHDFERAGGIVLRRTPVLSGAAAAHGLTFQLGDAEGTRVRVRQAINAAGLWAPTLAQGIAGIRLDAIPRPYFAIGHYFALAAPSPFRHLVYPVARAGGLGVHVTLDLAGAARFGPDISWRDGVDYRFDPSRAADFAAAIRRYYPALPDGALQPAFTGIRPKISGPEAPDQDFLIQDATAHGVPGLINLFGIESPGLTASLALAQEVAARLAA